MSKILPFQLGVGLLHCELSTMPTSGKTLYARKREEMTERQQKRAKPDERNISKALIR
jgi:hypothetical protein